MLLRAYIFSFEMKTLSGVNITKNGSNLMYVNMCHLAVRAMLAE